MVRKSFILVLIQLKEGIKSNAEYVYIKQSRSNLDLLRFFKKRGLIANITSSKKQKGMFFQVELRYINELNLLNNLEIVSRGGHKIYKRFKEIRTDFINNNYNYIISDSEKGLGLSMFCMKKKISGEVICKI